MNTLFNKDEEIKPIFRISDFGLVKYQKKESIDVFLDKNGLPSLASAYRKINEGIPKKKRGITSERQSIVKMFIDEINKEREGTKFKPVAGRGIAMKLSLLKTNQELYEFFSECRDYQKRKGSFGKRFFGGSKVKK